MAKKRKLSFGLMPASWGLKGKSRQIAEAEYYYEGEELEYKLCKINYKDEDDTYDYDLKKNDLDLKFKKISDFDHAHEKLKLDLLYLKINQEEHDLAVLDLKYAHERIGKGDYEKDVANIKKEPYVNVLSMGVDNQNVAQGYIELDWNDEFVKMLHEAGYVGTSDEDIVNKWFNQICRTVLLQSAADLDYGLEEMFLQQQERPDVIRKSSLGNQGANGSE